MRSVGIDLSSTDDEMEFMNKEESFLRENEKIETLSKEKQKEPWKVYFGF